MTRFNEAPAKRKKILEQIRINGQLLTDAAWLQMDTPTRLSVPDGFRMIIYPDSHSPFEDQGVLRAILDFADWYKPHLALDIGDFLDFDWLSRFPKNIKEGTPFNVRDAIESAQRQLRAKSQAGNPALLIVNAGNHDDRERRYLSEFAPALAGMVNGGNHNRLTDLATNILNFKPDDGVMFCWGSGQTGGREGGVFLQDYRLRHGNIIDAKPGYSAYKHVLKALDNIGIGHVHRAGDFAYETAAGLVKHGEEFGCTVDWNSPGFNYAANDHDWIRAFGLLEVHNGIVHVQVMPALIGQDANGRRREYFSYMDQDFKLMEFPVYE